MKAGKIIAALLSLMVIAFIGVQAYRSMYSPIRTETAIMYTSYDSITTTGLVLREEKIITSDLQGVKTFKIEDGGRVQKDGVIIEVFTNEEAAKSKAKITEIDREIEALTEVSRLSDNYVLHIDLLSGQVDEKIYGLRKIISNKDFIKLDEAKKEYCEAINKYRIGIGKETNYNERINALKEEKKELEKIKNTSNTVKSPAAGYFVSQADGFEAIIETDQIPKIGIDKYNELLKNKKEIPKNATGKIITNYDWYMVCTLSENDGKKITSGVNMNISLPFSLTEELEVSVVCLNSKPGKESVVVLKCSSMYEELSLIREPYVKLIINKHSGLRVSKKAVRFENGERGVFVLMGQEVKFKKIEALYTESNYMICKSDHLEENSLKLYDEVITEGKDLYDGKIIT